MCGLVMVVTKNKNGFSQVQQNIFNTLFYLSGGFRGADGAGAFVVDNSGNVMMAKEATRVHNFLGSKEYVELEGEAFRNGWAMVGHNRAATRGEVSDENSHPFVIDDKIVLVHNGTFYGSHKHIKDTNVDSEAIGHALLEEENIEEALKKINAAYALMWYNVEKKKLHVIRNDNRPLWHMELPDCYVYASEKIFLDFAIKRFSLAPTRKPFEIKAYNLGTFSLQNGGYDVNNADIECQPEVEWGKWPGQYYPSQNAHVPDYSRSIFEEAIAYYKDKFPMMIHADWALIREKYDRYTLVNAIVDDFIVNDETKPTSDYVMIGHTIDGTNLPVIFKIYNKSQEEALKYVDKVCSVSSTTCNWKRADEVYPVDQKLPMDKWPGIAFIHGYNPQIFEHNVH